MKDYNKSLRYRKHHQLGLKVFEKEGIPIHVFFGAIVATIFILFKIQYFKIIKASDFAFLMVFAIYQFILRPKIYRGEIKAYYRRYYDTSVKIISLYSFIGAVSVWKFIIIEAYEIIKTHDISVILTDIYHPKITSIIIVISLLMLYLTYYQDRYTTIKKYSNKINYKIKELGMDEYNAIHAFLFEKDKEYGIQQFRGMYYDYEKQENTELDESEDNDKNKEKNNDLLRREPRQKI